MPVFISHSHKDEAVYTPVCLALDGAGIPRWDVSEMSLGESLSDQLRSAIAECDQCVFIATRRSIESQWCLAELGAFWGADKTVIIYLADPDLEETVLPPQFRGNLTANDAYRLIDQIREAQQESYKSVTEDAKYEFFAASGDYGRESDWFRLLDETTERFDLLGIALGSWRRTKDFSLKVKEKAEAGCSVRILCMHPDNQLLHGLLYSEKDFDSVVHDIEESRKYYEKLADHPRIEFRQMTTGIPHFFLTQTDSYAVIIQYLSSQTWGSGPTWRCPNETDYYNIARHEFQTLWNSSQAPSPRTNSGEQDEDDQAAAAAE
ncbi:MAG: toll/interleukin-1 receptor domain-containing protein [Verrucomicrobiota bacterium]